MAPRFLKEIRLRLARGGFGIEAWTTRDLRTVAGVSYGRIIGLEKSGDIGRVRRGENGRLAFSPREVFFLLLVVELSLRERLEARAEKVRGFEPERMAA